MIEGHIYPENSDGIEGLKKELWVESEGKDNRAGWAINTIKGMIEDREKNAAQDAYFAEPPRSRQTSS